MLETPAQRFFLCRNKTMFGKWTCLPCFKSPLSSVIPPEPKKEDTTVAAEVPVPEVAAEVPVPEVAAEVPVPESEVETNSEIGTRPEEETPQAPEVENNTVTDPSSIQYIGITVKPYLPPLPQSPRRLCETRVASAPRFSIRQSNAGDFSDVSRA
jgi:hypothetical protein